MEVAVLPTGSFHVRAPNVHNGMGSHDAHANCNGDPDVLGPDEVEILSMFFFALAFKAVVFF